MRYRRINDNSRIVRYGGMLSADISDYFLIPNRCPFSLGPCRKKPCVCEMAFEREDMVVCPSRFEEGDVLFRSIASDLGCGGLPFQKARELKLSGSFFDFGLCFGRLPYAKYSFLEIQSLDISGSAKGEVRKLFPDAFSSEEKSKPVGPNWQMSIKTLFMELLKKARIAKAINAPLYVALQLGLWNYIKSKYGCFYGEGITFLVCGFPLDRPMEIIEKVSISYEGLAQMILSEKIDDTVTMNAKLQRCFGGQEK